ncbi:MAG: hypothetical protein ACRDTE_06125 [Pseudonocardiaceae bacterium]
MTIHKGSNDGLADLEPLGSEEPWSNEEPLCSEEEFAEEVRELVADEAPQVFALVEEVGERANGRVVAWGMAFDDCVEVVGVSGGLRASLTSAERAQRVFARHRKIRLVWTSPAATRQPQQVG